MIHLSAESCETVRLTDRQKRERDTYDSRPLLEHVDLDDYSRAEFGPWDPYWRVFDLVRRSKSQQRQQLLSYGCGRGAAALRYAALGYEVYGFDISRVAIENARQLALRCGLADKTDFTVQTAEALAYPAESFDLVVGENILHHVDLAQSVREIARVLKRPGVAIFKDSLATPIRDRIRNSRFVTRLVPQGTKDLTRGIRYTGQTVDERPLTLADLELLGAEFDGMRIERFRVLAALAILLGHRRLLEKLDWWLFRLLPPMRRFGDHVVIVLEKR